MMPGLERLDQLKLLFEANQLTNEERELFRCGIVGCFASLGSDEQWSQAMSITIDHHNRCGARAGRPHKISAVSNGDTTHSA